MTKERVFGFYSIVIILMFVIGVCVCGFPGFPPVFSLEGDLTQQETATFGGYVTNYSKFGSVYFSKKNETATFTAQNLTINGVYTAEAGLTVCTSNSTDLKYDLITKTCDAFCCGGIIPTHQLKDEDDDKLRTTQIQQLSNHIIPVFDILDRSKLLINSLSSLIPDSEIIPSSFYHRYHHHQRSSEYGECECIQEEWIHFLFKYLFKENGTCSSNGIAGNMWSLHLVINAPYDEIHEILDIDYCCDASTTYPLYFNGFLNVTSPYFGDQLVQANFVVNNFVTTYNPEFFEIPAACGCSP